MIHAVTVLKDVSLVGVRLKDDIHITLGQGQIIIAQRIAGHINAVTGDIIEKDIDLD
jgi:hypothetical protein